MLTQSNIVKSSLNLFLLLLATSSIDTVSCSSGNVSGIDRGSKTSLLCSTPSISSNAYSSCSYISSFATGYYCYVYCNSNYMWDDGTYGSKTTTCQSSGSWSSISPTCVLKCTAPSIPSNAYSSCSGLSDYFASGFECDMRCKSLYMWSDKTYGYKAIYCQSSGSWTSLSTSCVSSEVSIKASGILLLSTVIMVIAAIGLTNF